MKIENEVILAEAAALKKIYQKHVDDLKNRGIRISQKGFGSKFDWSQGAVSNYLNGLCALNVTSATNFAKELKCSVIDFSPRLDRLIKEQALSSNSIDTQALILKKVPIYNGFDISKILKNTEGIMVEPIRMEFIPTDSTDHLIGMDLLDDSMGAASNGSAFIINTNLPVMPKDTVLLCIPGQAATIRKIKVFESDGDIPVRWEAHPLDDSYPSYNEKTASITGVAIQEIKRLR